MAGDLRNQGGHLVFKDAFRAPSYFGFCLYDDEFPIIYINNSSAKSRQIFTLFHELGHLLFHTSGVDLLDDPFLKHLGHAEQRIEVICNGLAARVLVPETARPDAQGNKGRPMKLQASSPITSMSAAKSSIANF